MAACEMKTPSPSHALALLLLRLPPPFLGPPPRSLHFDGGVGVKAEHTVVHSVRQYSRLRYLRGRGGRQRPSPPPTLSERALTRP